MDLVQELKGVTSYAEGKQVDTVGISWAALALGKNVAERGKGRLLIEPSIVYRETTRLIATPE